MSGSVDETFKVVQHLRYHVVAPYQITVGYGDRHFNRCSVSPEMFVWLHLINPVTVDWGTQCACTVIKCEQSCIIEYSFHSVIKCNAF